MTNKELKRVIEVDASRCRSLLDLYRAILPVLGAPEWHGKNMNALTVSIVGGGINAVEPPYTSRFHGTADLPASIADELGWLKEDVADGREVVQERHGRDVDVELLP